MIVYSASDGYDASRYYRTRREAVTDAKAQSKEHEDMEVTVSKETLVRMDGAAILRLLNCAGGHVAKSEPVAVYVNGERL